VAVATSGHTSGDTMQSSGYVRLLDTQSLGWRAVDGEARRDLDKRWVEGEGSVSVEARLPSQPPQVPNQITDFCVKL
jgi:hypothetical protein